MKDIEIEKYSKKYLDDVLKLSERSISTSRTPDTWQANNMTAALALKKGELIGAIPMEKRTLSLGRGSPLNALWITGAHVDMEYRSQGIGSSIDDKIEDFFSLEAESIFVFRDDEKSDAYRWYKKLGYGSPLPVYSLNRSIEPTEWKERYQLWDSAEKFEGIGRDLNLCFQRYAGDFGGYPQRTPSYWRDKAANHYYKDYYKYYMVALTGSEGISSYAFLGETSIRDGVHRLDIFEFISSNDEKEKQQLLSSLSHFAHSLKVKEIRVRLTLQDPDLQWFLSNSFGYQGSFYILGKLFSPLDQFKRGLEKKKGTERFTIALRTPDLGEIVLGSGASKVHIYMDHGEFQNMLLCRCDIENALKDRKLCILNKDEGFIDVLKEIWGVTRWKYFHSDFI